MIPQAIKVLIVEDEPLIAEDIHIKLKYLGYAVTGIVDNGLEAIEFTAKTRPDLVLMDIVLRGEMDGVEAAETIRRQSGTPVIYLTVHSDQDFLDRAKITEPLGYIVKPCSGRDLHAALTVALYKTANDRHQREKNLLDATVVSLSDALVAWNLDGKIIRVNQALLTLLGIDEASLLGRGIAEVIVLMNLDNAKPLTGELVDLVERQGLLKDERDLLLRCGNQRLVAVRVSGNRIQDARRRPLGYVLLIHNDTERKQQEQALKESELRFKQLVSHLECLFCLCECNNGRVIHLNRAYEKIFGRQTQDAMTKNALFLNNTYAQDLDKAQLLLRAIHARAVCEETFRIMRPDDDLRWIHVRCYPVNDVSSGKVHRMAFIIDDVTDRKEAETILRQHARIFENTAEGIMMTDAKLNIVAINKAFTTITGYSMNDLHDMTPNMLVSGHPIEDTFETPWNTISQAGDWQGEIYSRRKDGESYPQWMSISTIRDDNGKVLNYFGIFSDISAIKKSREELDYLAHHDHLTGFANRLLFNARLEHAIVQADRAGEKVAVLLMDLDRFKGVNDSLGHAMGDLLLKQVAERLKACLREEDTLARQGGDEFIFLLEGLKHSNDMLWLAEKMLSNLAKPFILEEHEIIITASMGISIYPDDGQDVLTLVKHADMAMYKAKQQGKNRHAFYTEDLNVDSMINLTLATQMRQGLERNEFIVHYQPQISLHNGNITGFEALVRWRHPVKGMMPPAEFIPLAEESGFIEKLGEWVLYESCRQCKAWHEKGHLLPRIAVNLSAVQFIYSDIVATVEDVLKETGLEGKYLELEITESCLMHHLEQVEKKLDGLKALGVSLSIDDFGTGYSSLSYLKGFPIDKLKIDRSFIKNLPEDLQDCAISKAIIAMGKSLGLTVIAEGTETVAQRIFLTTHGCDELQGYLFSKPMPADEAEKLLSSMENPTVRNS